MAGNFNISYIIQIIDKMSPTLTKISSKLKNFSNHIKNSSKNLKNFGSLMTSVGQKATRLGRSLALRVSIPMTLLGRSILKAGMEMENINTAFTAMLGSTEKAKKMIEELWEMSTKTTLSFNQLSRSSKLLLNFGVEAKKITPLLKMLGDISDGNSQRFNVLSYNLAQVASLGRLTGIDLKSLRLSGFTPLKIIADETGKTVAELEKIMSQGGITFEHVAKAMKIATSEGGRFFNRMEIMSKTTEGRLNALKKEISALAITFGEEALPSLKSFIEILFKLTKKMKGLSPKTKKIILYIIAFGVVIAPLLIILGSLLSVLGFLFTSLGVLTTILALVATAIVALPVSWLVGGLIALLLLIKPIKKFFSWIFKKLGLIKQKSAESMTKFPNMKLEDINSSYRQTLDKSMNLNSNSKVDIGGMFTFANAPKGSDFQMTPMPKNSNANLGYNMSYAR